MLVEGTLFKGNLIAGKHTAACDDLSKPFYKRMEFCLIDICRALHTPIPVWMAKNSHELGAFHQTVFFDEQFMERVPFDRMLLRLLE